MSLLKYAEFLIETYSFAEQQNVRRNFLQAIGKKLLETEEYAYFNTLLIEGYTDQLFESINNGTPMDFLNEETLVQKFKNKFNDIKDKVKQGGQSALKALSAGAQAVLKFGGNLLAPVKAIIGKIAQAVKKAWDMLKAAAKTAVASKKDVLAEKFKAAMATEEKKASLRAEMKNVNSMAAAAEKWALSGFQADLGKAAVAAAGEDEKSNESTYFSTLESAMIAELTKEINEGNDLEGFIYESELMLNLDESELTLEAVLESGGEGKKLNIPFISKLMSKIHHIPPFSLFGKLGEAAGKVTNNTLERVSFYLAKVAGAPGPFKFIVLGSLVAIAVAYFTEHKVVHKIEHALMHGLHLAIPGLGMLFTILSTISIALAVYGLAEQLFGDAEEKPKKEA